MSAKPDMGPPWILFTDKGKPVAILPAMRPGEVANVAHLKMKQAKEIVRLANELHGMLFMAKLEGLQDSIARLAISVAEAGKQRSR